MSRRLLSPGVLVSALVAGAALASGGAAAGPSASMALERLAQPVKCRPGSVRAVIGGRATCLRTGVPCRALFAAQYRKYGFDCTKGRLAKAPKAPAPKPASYPRVPPLPAGPETTIVTMPPATPLPPGTATLALAGRYAPDANELAVASDSVWVAGAFRIDPATNRVSGPFTQAEAQDVGAGDGSVWASDYDGATVRRFDAVTGKQLAAVRLPLGATPEGIAVAGGAAWVASHHGGALIRIDAQTNQVAATVVLVPPGRNGPQGVAAGLGSVWVGVASANAVFRIDPAANAIAAIIPLPTSIGPCGGIAVGAGAVWVTSCLDGTKIARIDPATNTVASVLEVGGEVIQPAADGNSVWFVASADPDANANAPAYLLRLRSDDTVATRIRLPDGSITGGVAVAFDSVWLSEFRTPHVIRVTPR